MSVKRSKYLYYRKKRYGKEFKFLDRFQGNDFERLLALQKEFDLPTYKANLILNNWKSYYDMMLKGD